jgi:hypothetical protein
MMLMASVTTAEIVSARDNTPAAICSDIDTRFLTDLTCYDDYCAELEANCTEVKIRPHMIFKRLVMYGILSLLSQMMELLLLLARTDGLFPAII